MLIAINTGPGAAGDGRPAPAAAAADAVEGRGGDRPSGPRGAHPQALHITKTFKYYLPTPFDNDTKH
jgi:hypothetical protein